MWDPNIYTVGWICAIPTEYVAAQAFLDSDIKLRPAFVHKNDNNNYTLGRIGEHNVVIAVLPKGQYGTTSAAGVARDMLHSFPNIRIGLMVGIGGGAPTGKHDIRLGDIVVSAPQGEYGGVFQYDFGKTIQDREFQATGYLDQPPIVLGTAVSRLIADYKTDGHKIQESIEDALQRKPRLREEFGQPDLITDRLYRADVSHPPEAEGECMNSCGSDASSLVARRGREERQDNPTVHHGLIASANRLMKDAVLRDKLALEKGVLCFEMEAAGLMNHFPCLVIRGICDYSDTHKNKQWQGYAAMAAAAYAKDLLNCIPPNKVETEKKVSESLEKIQTQVDKLQADGHHNAVRNWLVAPEPSTNFNKAFEQRHKGTGQWLLQSEVYKTWKEEQNSFLWLHGIPGCGKTILSSSVVEDLRNDTKSSPTLLYFYFDFSDVEKRSLNKAVRSLIEQLYFKVKSVRKKTDDLYSTCDNGRHQPDQRSLLALFLDMLQYQRDSELWIVIDALDECHMQKEGAESALMKYIRKLRDCSANVHLLVTSRPEHDIQSAINIWARHSEIIPLQNTHVKDDINSYIKAKVGELKRWHERPDIQDEMETVLSDKANGMFRWVSCQLDVLSECYLPAQVRTALATLPADLDETYERILRKVISVHSQFAIRLLQFLIYSDRPLRLGEAVDAVAVDTLGKPGFKSEDRMPCPEEIVGFCSSLAILVKTKVPQYTISGERIEQEIVEIQLAHFSVQEYLMSDRLKRDIALGLDRSTANTDLTAVCLSYLLSLDHSGQPEEARKNYPLAQYSAQYWPTYAAVAEQSAGSTLPLVQEYFSSRPAINFCSQIYDTDTLHFGDEPRKSPDALYYASLTGLILATEKLVTNGANVNAEGGSYGYALHAASAYGHQEIVELLIKGGADVNATSYYGTALWGASIGGHQGVVQLLIEYGANTNAQDDRGHIPLHIASTHGYQEIVQILIGNGANINAQDVMGDTALQNASTYGYQEIVRLLIENGADINVQGGEYGNALQAALYKGHQAIAQILIDEGADVNAQENTKCNPLQVAASLGYPRIVQSLIERGSDINARDDTGYTALQAASTRGSQEIVELLIEKGADINAQGGEYGNALQAALHNRHHAIAQLLIERGADVNARGALRAASAPVFDKEQKESDEGKQTQSHKRKHIDPNQDSIAKKPHL